VERADWTREERVLHEEVADGILHPLCWKYDLLVVLDLEGPWSVDLPARGLENAARAPRSIARDAEVTLEACHGPKSPDALALIDNVRRWRGEDVYHGRARGFRARGVDLVELVAEGKRRGPVRVDLCLQDAPGPKEIGGQEDLRLDRV
jgi:hypothetical protein